MMKNAFRTAVKLSKLLKTHKHDQSMVVYPVDHKFAMEVPEGGSNCEKCIFLTEDHKGCTNKTYIAWNGGSDRLLKDDEIFCCDNFSVKPNLK